MVEHSCKLEDVRTKHRNLTSSLIAHVLYDEIIEKHDMECSYIQVAIHKRFKYNISYSMAWRAKQKALERRFGSYEASYCNLPCVLDVLNSNNPGTYTTFQDIEGEEGGEVFTMFKRAFIASGPCISSFHHCRPLLCVDGTFLIGKYKGQILTDVGVDANNQILPVAFAFVESENKESWL
uniref:MULE transposase domain-containing protein n=1 Tax=Arundo donax TaxID=35708 RepID=A0A0A8ZA30_ARUDO